MTRRRIGLTAGAILLGIVAVLTWERARFDRGGWIADYRQLQNHMAAHYANLLWTVEARKLDLAALDRTTLRRLREAGTGRAARTAIADFLKAFGDGHLRISRTPLSRRVAAWWQGGEAPAALDAATPGEAACAALGFNEDSGGLEFGLRDEPGFQSLERADNSFAAGTLGTGAAKIGVIRIPTFDHGGYRAACIRAWAAYRTRIAGRCEESCREAFAEVAVPNQLLAELSSQVSLLAEGNVALLAVDITGNGGGTDWVDPAARIFTAKPLSCPALGFVKGPHWGDRLDALRGKIETDLAAPLPDGDKAILIDATARLDRLANDAKASCDLSAIWSGQPPACSNLVHGLSACGLVTYLPPDALRGAGARTALFDPARFTYSEGVYTGRLALLVDGASASASEYFAAMLADNGAATVLGQRTFGAGCGYTNGGLPAVLDHSGLRIDMPDCQRLRRGGGNELDGIVPDVEIPWSRGEGASARRAKLLKALGGLP